MDLRREEGKKALTSLIGAPGVIRDAQGYQRCPGVIRDARKLLLRLLNWGPRDRAWGLSSWTNDHRTPGQKDLRQQKGVGVQDRKCLEGKDTGSCCRGKLQVEK